MGRVSITPRQEQCQFRTGRCWKYLVESCPKTPQRRVDSPEELTVPRRAALERSRRELSENALLGYGIDPAAE